MLKNLEGSALMSAGYFQMYQRYDGLMDEERDE